MNGHICAHAQSAAVRTSTALLWSCVHRARTCHRPLQSRAGRGSTAWCPRFSHSVVSSLSLNNTTAVPPPLPPPPPPPVCCPPSGNQSAPTPSGIQSAAPRAAISLLPPSGNRSASPRAAIGMLSPERQSVCCRTGDRPGAYTWGRAPGHATEDGGSRAGEGIQPAGTLSRCPLHQEHPYWTSHCACRHTHSL